MVSHFLKHFYIFLNIPRHITPFYDINDSLVFVLFLMKINIFYKKMKTETIVKKIIKAVTEEKPTTITINGKKFRISKQIINSYKNKSINDIDDNLLRNIDEEKEGGILPLLPLIFGGIAAAGALAGGAAGIAKSVNQKHADARAYEETKRHNAEIEKLAKGSGEFSGEGFSDLVDTIKEFGKKFAQETRKTVKDGLMNLAENVKIEKKGEGLYLSPYNKGEGLYLSKQGNAIQEL